MTERQASLLAKGRKSIDAARLLAEREMFDFAVSRAYYAMFYAAQAMLLERGLEFSKQSAVISAFGKHFARTARVAPEFHRYLIECEDARRKGDYDFVMSDNRRATMLHIARAEQFLELAKGMLGPLPSQPGKDG